MASLSDLEKPAQVSPAPAHDENGSVTQKGEEVATPLPEKDFQPPDGGLAAWTQVLACTLINMVAWGYPAAFGVFQLYYRDALELPESQISWIGSLQIFLASVMCAPAGRLADAGYVKSTVIVGSFMIVLGTMLTSLCKQYWQIFLAQGLFTGLGMGIVFMPVLSVMSSYFAARRSLALSFAATGTGFGSVVFPATIQYLIPRVGFPWAVRCTGFVILFLTAVVVAILRPKLRPRTSGPLFEWDAFREGPYLLFTLGTFLFFWALYFCYFYINAYARNVIHFSTLDSVQLLLIMDAVGVPARPLAGYLATRHFGPINTYIIHMMLLGCMLFVWIGVTTRTGMYVFVVFFGFTLGATQGLYSGSLTSLTKDPRRMGTRYGMSCTMSAFATLAGPPTAGAIIDTVGGRYLWTQIWAGLVMILASLVLAAARCAATGFKFRVKV
ncbi:hypothetical protein VTH06DRAFT_1313 [Thermothelomyces fergusii]